MESRNQSPQQKKSLQEARRYKWILALLISAAALFIIFMLSLPLILKQDQTASTNQSSASQASSGVQISQNDQVQTARITASGDMLYHDIVYGSAYDGQTYDFANDYEQIRPLISSADLALGDFEGTINPNYPLSGYPIFNAPEEVVASIKDAGFDAIDLAHNHILDTGLDGLLYTANAFKKAGLDYFGVKQTADEPYLIKEVNGIKIAILGFVYGYNGLEVNLTQEEYDTHLYDLNMDKVKAAIDYAEQNADITIIMPQMGVEYALEPSQEQIDTYHQMINWGADIIFGGHPHVAEPTETMEVNGDKKFIIYSMGNLLSNQRYETLENYWTERGVIMDVTIKKTNGKTTIDTVTAHPTWVSREPINRTFNGVQAYDYQVYLAEDYITGGQYAGTISAEKQARIQQAYDEMMDLLNIQF